MVRQDCLALQSIMPIFCYLVLGKWVFAPFSHGTGTLLCLQKEMATYRHWSVSLWRDPDDVSHCQILYPDKTEWWLISATLYRWRRCFVADQLWLMKRIQEEDYTILHWLLLLLFLHYYYCCCRCCCCCLIKLKISETACCRLGDGCVCVR